jgi:hypothetical protein
MYEQGCQDRAGSWRTRKLVKWKLSAGSGLLERLHEPCTLDQYTDLNLVAGNVIPDGWTRHEDLKLAIKSEYMHENSLFTHAKDNTAYFKHPIPLKEDRTRSSILTTPAYLIGSTTTASFFPATLLRQYRSSDWVTLAPSKISVFEDKIFKDGPRSDKSCPILVLQQPNGAFAGLIRLMSSDHLDELTPLELIAISTGSASAQDLRKSLEWKVFETGKYEYKDGNNGRTLEYIPDWISDKGKYALLFDVAMAFDKEVGRNEPLGSKFDTAVAEIEQRSNEMISAASARYPDLPVLESSRLREWFKVRKIFLQERVEATLRDKKVSTPKTQRYPARVRWNMLKHQIRNRSFFELIRNAAIENSPSGQHLHNQEESICEFYNILWVERREGIAYRRACGWVPKYVWEAHSKGLVEVKLG